MTKLQIHRKRGRELVTDVKEADAYREQSLQNVQKFEDPSALAHSNGAVSRSRELGKSRSHKDRAV